MRFHIHRWTFARWSGPDAATYQCLKCEAERTWGWDSSHFYYGKKIVPRTR